MASMALHGIVFGPCLDGLHGITRYCFGPRLDDLHGITRYCFWTLSRWPSWNYAVLFLDLRTVHLFLDLLVL